MSARATFATTRRVLEQLRRDHRTLALVLVVPPALLVLLRYVLDGSPGAFQRVAVPLVGLFPLIVMFLVTSIAMLRERTGGTLERLMSLPLSKLDLLAGYGLAFALLAAAQASVTSLVAFGLLGVDTAGSKPLVVALAVSNALLGVGARSLPERVCDERVPGRAVHAGSAAAADPPLRPLRPTRTMPRALRIASDALPVTYAYDGLDRVARGLTDGRLWLDAAVVLGTVALSVALGSTTLRRRTP